MQTCQFSILKLGSYLCIYLFLLPQDGSTVTIFTCHTKPHCADPDTWTLLHTCRRLLVWTGDLRSYSFCLLSAQWATGVHKTQTGTDCPAPSCVWSHGELLSGQVVWWEVHPRWTLWAAETGMICTHFATFLFFPPWYTEMTYSNSKATLDVSWSHKNYIEKTGIFLENIHVCCSQVH